MQASAPELKVLVIEDDLVLQKVLLRWLQSLGYHVDIARTVREANQRITDVPFDILLLDMSLPDGNGFAVMEQAYTLGDPPLVIITTADHSASTAIEALRRAAFDYLPKPVNADILRRTIQRASEHIVYRRTASERARQHAQEQAVQATARAAVHHLSQDLTVILGEAQLLEEEVHETPQVVSVRRIIKAAINAAAKLSTLRRARRFVVADYVAGDKILDLDAASGDVADLSAP